MAFSHMDASAVVLPDGDALVVGGLHWTGSGFEQQHVERFDVASGTWSAGAITGTPRMYSAIAKLSDGRVLSAGGYGIYDEYTSADLYDPRTDTWTPVAPMHVVRTMALAAGLPDGRVLVAGGHSRATKPQAIDPAAGTYEIYDPRTDTWTEPAPLSRRRAGYAQLVTLSDGRIVLTGGYNGPSYEEPYGADVGTADVYDPETGTWTETGRAARAAPSTSRSRCRTTRCSSRTGSRKNA
ncbi:Kelch repeat-containing protein [Solirubrobacter soli]|uniref:Kelch repeat-containing protein n=1 Tax=Solirubrobacter soli TaxID=363832 RepID=UPI000425FB5D|nr:kelch repeat-containing protein [Solirubrobacter soli]